MKPLYLKLRNIKARFDPVQLEDVAPGATRLPSDLVFRFYCSAFDDYGQSGKVTVTDWKLAAEVPELHPLKFPLNDLRFVRGQKLLVSVLDQSKGETVVGQAAFGMEAVSEKAATTLSGVLQLSSRVVGGIVFDCAICTEV